MNIDIKAICDSAVSKRYLTNSPEKALLEKLLYEHLYNMSKRLKNKLSNKVGYSVVEQEISTKTLVQEIYVKIFSSTQSLQESEKNIVLNITNLSRTVIFDLARHVNSQKEQRFRETQDIEKLDESAIPNITKPDYLRMVMIDGAVTKLAGYSPDAYEVYLLKQFGGFTEIEIAELLQISRYEVRKHIDSATKFIKNHLQLH